MGDITLQIRRANSTNAYATFSTTDAVAGPARVVHSAYAVNHKTLGQAVCYLCDLTLSDNNTVWTVVPRDAFHRRVYIEPLGTVFSLDTGTIDFMTVDWKAKTVALVLSAVSTPALFTVYQLHVDHPATCTA